MYIDRLIINNFRAYKEENILELSVIDNKNVSIISGNNGYGKTSLLTSLVWCLYGKLMADVDERYRKEIYDSGGYKSYCHKLMNHIKAFENAAEVHRLNLEIKYAKDSDRKEITDQLEILSTFSVSIRFKKVFVPVIPCNSLEIIRRYNIYSQTETLRVLIDDKENELTKQVGPEIFINDFILRKEIAKFFFFDAEKIVELAEINTIEGRRNLSRSYSEVLGIKKYLDLKDNLENLRERLRKRNSSQTEKERLEKLNSQYELNQRLIQHKQLELKDETLELSIKRLKSDKLQEQLIREGSSITLDEMKDYKLMKEHLQEENTKLKNKMKEMMELAPLAIAASKVEAVKVQLEAEQAHKDKKIDNDMLRRKYTALKRSIYNSTIKLQKNVHDELFKIIEKVLLPTGSITMKTLFDFSTEQENSFFAVYDNLNNSYSKTFATLNSELKKQYTSIAIVNRKLVDAESKENDPVIKSIRSTKIGIDYEIRDLERKCIDYKAELITLENAQNNISLQLSELNKKISVEEIDKVKDQTAERLIKELEAFTFKLKLCKKQSLEENILNALHMLMHKQGFITKVEVFLEGDLIDIQLYDKNNRQIDKNTLSKGEQQIYATALLKALVEESHIRFPVFIDSPLQKFDKEHAKNIIQDFYPNVSAQVILFPLLEKELNEEEFNLLFPIISDCFLIQQKGQYQSSFQKVEPRQLFDDYINKRIHVY